MKKIFLLWAALMPMLASVALPVEPDRATAAARGFWSGTLNAKHAEQLQQVDWPYDGVYLFMAGNAGWVMMSADDAASPVLAYSLTSTFDPENMPVAVQNIVWEYQQEVAALAEAGGTTAHEGWSLLEAGHALKGEEDDPVGPLLSTAWYQTYPYNMLCPSNTMTGCVATAMAQVMKFWNYPAFGVGEHAYSDGSGYGVQSADFAHTRYDWDNMPSRLTGSSSAAEKTAVATLIYHCGVSVNMNYSPTYSGTSGAHIIPALTTYFHYDGSEMRYRGKGNLSNEDWTDTLIRELRHLRPIMYGGSGPAGGHSFVCDGFDSRRYLHFNLGENGAGDGYYQIGTINYGSYTFNSENDAVLGIKPGYGIYASDGQFSVNRYATSQGVWVCTNDTSSAPWTAMASDRWLSVENTAFARLGEMTIRMAENTSGMERTGTITLEQAGQSATITVVQSAYDPASDYCPLTVEMENTRGGAWADGAHLTFESPSGYVYGTARHSVNGTSSVVQVDVAPHDVVCVWHEGGAFDRYINYRVKNQYGEELINVQNAYFEGGNELIVWPCVPVGIDDVATPQVSVSPNPTAGVVNISAEDLVRAELYDINGRKLGTAERNMLDMSFCPAGTYALRVVTSSGIYVTRIVKR